MPHRVISMSHRLPVSGELSDTFRHYVRLKTRKASLVCPRDEVSIEFAIN